MLPPLLLRLFRRPKRPNYSTAQSDALRAYWVGLWWELERERDEKKERERDGTNLDRQMGRVVESV